MSTSMIGTIVLTLILAYVVRYYMITRRKDGSIPGPWIRFPLIGHSYYLFKGQSEGFKRLKAEFGSIYNVLIGPTEMTYITEYNLCHEMFSKEVFCGRINMQKLLKNDTMMRIKGGSGHHGIICSSGEEWKEQRRFALRHLKEFGFGKASMNDVITEEWDDLSEVLRKAHDNDEEIETHLLFNLSALNVLWRIVAGKRFNLNDSKQSQRLKELAEWFSQFGVNVYTIIGFTLPNWLYNVNIFITPIEKIYKSMFQMFEDEYKEHEKTYDPDYMRDFIDIYMTERNRVNKANEKSSSFYGETGHWNYVNAMFDLFLAGSETTSTTMVFFILYLLHHPSQQRLLQEEIDSVVGRDRQPTLDDRDNMPKVLAFISEVHRRATIAPHAGDHATTHPVDFKGYKFHENQVVISSLRLIMNDPEKFPNPEKFDPTRFIDPDTGKYKASPYMCQYGIGKRECLGMALAKNEQFIFLTNLLHSFSIEPSSTEMLPGVDDVKLSATRIPAAFKARFIPRI